MVLNQRPLGLRDCLLDRVKLLGDVEARPAGLDHLDDPAQMAVRALEALHDRCVSSMSIGLFVHNNYPIPLEGIMQPAYRQSGVSAKSASKPLA